MLIGTLCQILVVPALFVIFQSLQEKFKPMQFEEEVNEEVAAELAQYAHQPIEDYKVEE
jgi:HAE1 family hydrophobic/amphiphilic exporter-1